MCPVINQTSSALVELRKTHSSFPQPVNPVCRIALSRKVKVPALMSVHLAGDTLYVQKLNVFPCHFFTLQHPQRALGQRLHFVLAGV
jgi:hypothetical protein